MPRTELTQNEADALLAVEKIATESTTRLFPMPGGKVEVPLQSRDGREVFMLDVARASIRLTKATFQNRARQVVVLIRVDIDGPPHRNPDGREIPCPHLHVYREGFGDKWAQPLPNTFTNPKDLWQTFVEFCQFSNIADPSPLERGLGL